MISRPWVAIWLSPLALSPTALVWATAIGAFSTLVLVPGTSGAGLFTWQWLAVVAASQAVFAAIIIAVRRLSPTLGPITVLVTLAVSGCSGCVSQLAKARRRPVRFVPFGNGGRTSNGVRPSVSTEGTPGPTSGPGLLCSPRRRM